MIGLSLAIAALVLAAFPALTFLRNLNLYRPCPQPTRDANPKLPGISVLIPARNEERSIRAALDSVLANRYPDFEVLVLDDRSDDRTGEIVAEVARTDDRVTLMHGPPLPPGWCGKQHACAVLASAATRPLLLFLDADVRLQPDALFRLARQMDHCGADLLSGIPRQETGTLLEKLVIPLIHFVLLGFLPLDRMRESRHPAFAAGCGQLFLAKRSAYEAMGGHATIRATLHDGIRLPRAFREAGFRTDLCDVTDLAVCRMYRGAAELWRGLAKNATEGLGSPRLIVPATVLLLGGQVLPFVLAALSPWMSPTAIALAWLAVVLAWLPRWLALFRFHQSLTGAILHPLGILVLLAIQWYALVRGLVGGKSDWKGRHYQPGHLGAGVGAGH
jgi:hypothetical protein